MTNKLWALLAVLCIITTTGANAAGECVPAYGMNWIWGSNDEIGYVDNIPSWEPCGLACHNHKSCNYWVWEVANSPQAPYRCWFYVSTGTYHNDDRMISGWENCYRSSYC